MGKVGKNEEISSDCGVTSPSGFITFIFWGPLPCTHWKEHWAERQLTSHITWLLSLQQVDSSEISKAGGEST